jgi:hypothetical protein
MPQGLGSCPDCGQAISHRAEACPHCGCFIQNLRTPVIVSRQGWTWSIAWGVILAGIIVWFISFALTLLIMILFFGAVFSNLPTSRPPSSYNRMTP